MGLSRAGYRGGCSSFMMTGRFVVMYNGSAEGLKPLDQSAVGFVSYKYIFATVHHAIDFSCGLAGALHLHDSITLTTCMENDAV